MFFLSITLFLSINDIPALSFESLTVLKIEVQFETCGVTIFFGLKRNQSDESSCLLQLRNFSSWNSRTHTNSAAEVSFFTIFIAGSSPENCVRRYDGRLSLAGIKCCRTAYGAIKIQITNVDRRRTTARVGFILILI